MHARTTSTNSNTSSARATRYVHLCAGACGRGLTELAHTPSHFHSRTNSLLHAHARQGQAAHVRPPAGARHAGPPLHLGHLAPSLPSSFLSLILPPSLPPSFPSPPPSPPSTLPLARCAARGPNRPARPHSALPFRLFRASVRRRPVPSPCIQGRLGVRIRTGRLVTRIPVRLISPFERTAPTLLLPSTDCGSHLRNPLSCAHRIRIGTQTASGAEDRIEIEVAGLRDADWQHVSQQPCGRPEYLVCRVGLPATVNVRTQEAIEVLLYLVCRVGLRAESGCDS